MLRVSRLMRVNVYQPRRGHSGDPAELDAKSLSRIGQVRQVVFTPKGNRVVGLLVRRPDAVGMIKRPDAFVALDSFTITQAGIVVTKGEEGLDQKAIDRLGLEWDSCILWRGMDAKTTDGKELGWVADVEFNASDGLVQSFYVGDGSLAESLVGDVVIPGSMLRGYQKGYMLVDPEAATLSLDGGLAAKAGEGYARAKQNGKAVASKAGKAADEAVQKGARSVGRAIGKAKKSDPQKVVKKQLGKTKGMFGSFMDEYRKASK